MGSWLVAQRKSQLHLMYCLLLENKCFNIGKLLTMRQKGEENASQLTDKLGSVMQMVLALEV